MFELPVSSQLKVVVAIGQGNKSGTLLMMHTLKRKGKKMWPGRLILQWRQVKKS